MKKIAYLALSAASALVSAEAAPRAGFYAGAGVGAVMMKSEVKADGKLAGDQYAGKWDAKKTGVAGELVAGYDYAIDSQDFVLNAELFATMGSLNYKKAERELKKASGTDPVNFANSLKQTWGVGLRLRPGYNVSKDGQVFLTFGAQMSQFKYNRAHPTDKEIKADKSRTAFGVIFGAGYKHHLNDNLALTLEYNYVIFGKIKAEGKKDADNTIADNFKPKNHKVMLGMRYYF